MPKRLSPEQHQELALRVNEARLATLGTLVAGLAHEINTPIGALHSNHDLLRRAVERLQLILADDVVEPHELEELRRVVRALDGFLHVSDLAVERLDGLVKSLRTFGRLDRADLDLVDVHEGIDSTLEILGHELKGVHVVRDYGTLPRVLCFPQRLNQVFMNLLLNARQATPPGGTITIDTRTAENAVEIAIADTGSGIAPEHIARIFEPGFTTRGGRIGMGLGLPICRQIVEQHGGELRVESEPGAGARFTLRLPLQPPDLAPNGTHPEPETGA